MDFLGILRRELDAFGTLIETGDLKAPVEHCGDWTVRELAEHLGQGNLWVAGAVTERRGDFDPRPAPADIVPWFAETARVMAGALDVDPATEAWTFAPPRTVAFWQRRRTHETVVHRWDAEHALGLPSELDPQLCADAVAEVGETFLPRQVRLGRCAEPPNAVRFTATDVGESWVLGPGEPVAELAGTAGQIMLALWDRQPWSALTGDHETARRALPGPIVP